MRSVAKISVIFKFCVSAKTVDYAQFYFHFFGNYIFYVNGCLLTRNNARFIFGESRKVRRQFNKYTVIFDRAHNSANGLPDIDNESLRVAAKANPLSNVKIKRKIEDTDKETEE